MNIFNPPPFGMQIQNRSYTNGDKGYRFGFNGKEKDIEGLGGGGSTYDYGFRIYNSALGRFLSVDPLCSSFPWYTPYQFAGNNPIRFIDLDGRERADPEEFIKAMKIVTDFLITAGDCKLSNVVDILTFATQVNQQLTNAYFDEGNSMNQGNSWLCGIAASSYMYLTRDPVSFASAMVKLYENGVTNLNGNEISPSDEMKSMAADENGAVGTLLASDYIWLGSIRNSLNDLLSYDPANDGKYSGGTWPTEIDELVCGYFGLSLSSTRIYTGENMQEMENAVGDGKALILFGNAVMTRGNKKNNKDKNLNESLGKHYIVVEDLFDYDAKNKTVTFRYWDYGSKYKGDKDLGTQQAKKVKLTETEFRQGVKASYIEGNNN